MTGFDPARRVVYLDGNSLGALPPGVARRLADVVPASGARSSSGPGASGWWTAPERIGDRSPRSSAPPRRTRWSATPPASTSSRRWSAPPGCARPGRDEMLVDDATFPTDGYIAAVGGPDDRPHRAPVRPADRGSDGEDDDRRRAGSTTSTTAPARSTTWPALTAAVARAGALACGTCATAPARCRSSSTRDGVDLAVGCTYKYLNGGPGPPAYLYVAPRTRQRPSTPRSPAGTATRTPFGMAPDYAPAAEGDPRPRRHPRHPVAARAGSRARGLGRGAGGRAYGPRAWP